MSRDFDKLWTAAKEQKLLSFEVLDSVPGLLSESTQKKLAKKSPEEVATVIRDAINQINSGSIKTIDELVRSTM